MVTIECFAKDRSEEKPKTELIYVRGRDLTDALELADIFSYDVESYCEMDNGEVPLSWCYKRGDLDSFLLYHLNKSWNKRMQKEAN